jgi:hypothetical protein
MLLKSYISKFADISFYRLQFRKLNAGFGSLCISSEFYNRAICSFENDQLILLKPQEKEHLKISCPPMRTP